MFSDCLFTAFVHSFWMDLVTTVSHEQLEQSWLNLQPPIDALTRFWRSKVNVTVGRRDSEGILVNTGTSVRLLVWRILCMNLFVADCLLLARLMGQCCFACWRLSSSSVTLPAGRARGRSGGRHCTAGQYGYVPLERHLHSADTYYLSVLKVSRHSSQPICIVSLLLKQKQVIDK